MEPPGTAPQAAAPWALGPWGNALPRPEWSRSRGSGLGPAADGCCLPQASEKRVARLGPQWAPSDRQLLRDVADRGRGGGWPGLLAAGGQAAGAESRELPQRLHRALHREQLHDLLLQVGALPAQTGRWTVRRPGREASSRGAGKPPLRSVCPCPPPGDGRQPLLSHHQGGGEQQQASGIREEAAGRTATHRGAGATPGEDAPGAWEDVSRSESSPQEQSR